jgi:hypothetical protein
MITAKTAIVYSHQFTDPHTGYGKIAPSKRTAEGIELIDGWIIDGTAETVDASLIDSVGKYRPPIQ